MRTLALALSVALCASSALAQDVPQIGVNRANLRQPTYSTVAVGLVPAAGATDIMCIGNPAARTVVIDKVMISGVAGTLVTVPFTLVRRATPDTGGTQGTGAAAPAVVAHNSTNLASVVTVTTYTANPTINDATPSPVRGKYLTLPTTSAAMTEALVWNLGTQVDAYDQRLDLVKGTQQQACINLNGSTISGGSLVIAVEWVEI